MGNGTDDGINVTIAKNSQLNALEIRHEPSINIMDESVNIPTKEQSCQIVPGMLKELSDEEIRKWVDSKIDE
jgi:hypothetical protein